MKLSEITDIFKNGVTIHGNLDICEVDGRKKQLVNLKAGKNI